MDGMIFNAGMNMYPKNELWRIPYGVGSVKAALRPSARFKGSGVQGF